MVARPKSAPDRVDWLRTALVDHGVSVALISTPQFDKQCAHFEKHIGWNAAQIKGRVMKQTILPAQLPVDDLEAVARKIAPYADEASLLRLVGYAQSSDDYLAGIERLACRAAFFAFRDGRDIPGKADIKRALDEAVQRVEVVTPSPKPKPRKPRGSAHATALQTPGKPLSDSPPHAFARRASMESPASEEAGFEASGRLQFTEAAVLG